MFKASKRIGATDTLIGQGTVAEGKLICEASLRIEGEYRGDIECTGDVIIGECGIARSNITACDITLAGTLYGDIIAKGQLIITSSGQLMGNITTPSLIIHDGGKLNGNCFMAIDSQTPQASNDSSAAKTVHHAQAADSKQRPAGDSGSMKSDETKAKSRQAG